MNLPDHVHMCLNCYGCNACDDESCHTHESWDFMFGSDQDTCGVCTPRGEQESDQ